MANQQAVPAGGVGPNAGGGGMAWWAVDALVACGLAIALGAVFVLEPAAPANPGGQEVTVTVAPPVVETVEQDAPVVEPPKLAATPAEFDDVGRLLRELGKAYDYETIPLDSLQSPKSLGDFDILFLSCGTFPESWLGDLVGAGERGTEVHLWKPEVKERVDRSLREFVETGGTLYASDWRFNLVASAFPEFVDAGAVAEGSAQNVKAEVVDEGLREKIGTTIDLRFDLAGWKPAAFRGKEVVTILSGPYEKTDGTHATAPLLVKFPVGKGTVIFTSFHNEKQNSKAELELLRHLVFATVTARVESQVAKTMIQGGFSPAKQNLLSASGGSLKVTKKYRNESGGDLQFALGFEATGAELALEIVGPDGRTFAKKGKSTFQIDVPGAARGDWEYTVTALKVPYENFPFTLTVGEKR